MKKILLLISTVALIACTANAQDMMSKKGTSIVPEAKDWGLGVDANPFLSYFGNAFNHSDNSTPSWDFTTYPMVITGLMVKDATTAYRGKLRLGIGSHKNTYVVDEDASTATPQAKTEDEQKVSNKNIVIGAGIQKMRGKHRIHGIYGAEAYIGLGGSKTTNKYGNPFSTNNPQPTTGIPGQSGPSRETEVKQGGTFMFGVRGFIGAEYFFAPKISIAGEFGWGPALSSTGASETTTETQGANGAGTSTTAKSGKSSSFSFDTDNNGGSLRMTFYF